MVEIIKHQIFSYKLVFYSSLMLFMILGFGSVAQDKKERPNFFIIQDKVKNEKLIEHWTDKEKKHYRRWEWFWSSRTDAFGNMDVYGKVMYDIARKHLSSQSSKDLVTLPLWENVSAPDPVVYSSTNSPNYNNSGRVSCIWVDDDNRDYMLAGTASGGLWKSIDGGINWVCKTDDVCSIGVNDIMVDAVNDVIYISTESITMGILQRPGVFFGMGVWKSYDNGETWEILNMTVPGDLDYGDSKHAIRKVIMVPKIDVDSDPDNNILYAISRDGVWKSSNSGGSWTYTNLITWGIKERGLTDIICDPNNNQNVFVGGSLGFWKSAPNGSWTPVVNTNIPANNTFICVGLAESNGEIYLAYNYRPKTTEWWNISNNEFCRIRIERRINGVWEIVNEFQNLDNILFAIKGSFVFKSSPVDPSHFYFGGTKLHFSNNYASDFEAISTYNTYIHADKRDVFILENSAIPGKDIVWCATDGGISVSYDYGGTGQYDWDHSSTGNLNIYQFYDLANYEPDNNLFVGGLQDCGSVKHTSSATWSHIEGCDGGTTIIDYSNPENVYTTCNGFFSTHSGKFVASLDIAIHNGTVMQHPSNPDLFYGASSQYLLTFDRNNPSSNWDTLKHTWSLVSALDISKSNPNVMYFARRNVVDWSIPVYYPVMYRSIDNGLNWTTLSVGSPDYNECDISDIEIDPNNPNRVWITYSGLSEGVKVWYTEDGGDTWETDFSQGLDNIPIHSIQFDPNGQCLYIATEWGVYYRTPQMSQWDRYGVNLPNTIVTKILINSSSEELIAATFGRGVWKVPLYCNPPLTFFVDCSYNHSGPYAAHQNSYFAQNLFADCQLEMDKSVEFKATEKITLQPGFFSDIEDESNNFFIAYIDKCDESDTQSFTSNFGNISFAKPESENLIDEQKGIDNLEYLLYPNPNNGVFNIESNSDEEMSVKIYDLLGKIVYNSTLLSNSLLIDISDKPKGIYAVRIQLENTEYVEMISYK